MKKLVIVLGILSSIITFGQAYIDSNGNLQRKPRQYRDPMQVDISSTINAASTLQSRYNSNIQRLQSEYNSIVKRINNYDISYDQKKEILTRLENYVSNNINNRSFDYSSDSITNSLIKYLYESVNKITHDVTD
ncbi:MULTISPECIES: hypothetical protein [Elizabethkingia]|nr:hypothetical protein [Elizabethkingia anophelis]EQB94123.1 hypothetical protein C874_05100 [Elizabethkingia anophelis 502]MCT3760829.1 hypothetical protein [Elizabethkingia anophelis]